MIMSYNNPDLGYDTRSEVIHDINMLHIGQEVIESIANSIDHPVPSEVAESRVLVDILRDNYGTHEKVAGYAIEARMEINIAGRIQDKACELLHMLSQLPPPLTPCGPLFREIGSNSFIFIS